MDANGSGSPTSEPVSGNLLLYRVLHPDISGRGLLRHPSCAPVNPLALKLPALRASRRTLVRNRSLLMIAGLMTARIQDRSLVRHGRISFLLLGNPLVFFLRRYGFQHIRAHLFPTEFANDGFIQRVVGRRHGIRSFSLSPEAQF